jgi:uncharacterized repeat protein (TIGR03833 family)
MNGIEAEKLSRISLQRKREDTIMQGNTRSNIKPGTKVRVVQKQDQASGKLTEGVVQKLLTNSATHPHGIKVMLEGGIVGRVQEIL